MGWKPKSMRQLAANARQNLYRARRNVGCAWRQLKQMEMELNRINRLRPLPPR